MTGRKELSGLEELIDQIRAIESGLASEQATREVAVNPVIGALGWNTLNPAEVDREYSVLGGRVDYCLRTPSRNFVFIEVKRAGIDLNDHEEQLLQYAFKEGVPLAVLTNGLLWWLYLPRAEGSWTQRRFFQIDLLEHDPRSVASALNRFLNRDGVITGSARREAQREFDSQARERRVRAAMGDAWRRVLSDPESLLPDLLAEEVQKITGHTPSMDTIAEFLAGVSGADDAERELWPPHPRGKVPPRKPPATDAKRTKPTRGSRPAAFWLDETRHEVKSWRWMMVRVCELLADEAGSSFPERVAGLRGRTRAYFSPSGDEHHTPIQISNLEVYVEGNVSARAATRVAKRTVAAVRGSDHGFRVELQGEAPSAAGPAASQESPGTATAAPAPENVSGLRPVAFWLDEERHKVVRWNQVLHGLCDLLSRETGASFSQKVAPLRGRNRLYFSEDPEDLRRPQQVGKLNVHVERNLSANQCVRVARLVLKAVRGSDEGFRIEVEKPNAAP